MPEFKDPRVQVGGVDLSEFRFEIELMRNSEPGYGSVSAAFAYMLETLERLHTAEGCQWCWPSTRDQCRVGRTISQLRDATGRARTDVGPLQREHLEVEAQRFVAKFGVAHAGSHGAAVRDLVSLLGAVHSSALVDALRRARAEQEGRG